eukprot:scaffold248655_cov86-Cyclotella_meneghiniana.AAC.1
MGPENFGLHWDVEKELGAMLGPMGVRVSGDFILGKDCNGCPVGEVELGAAGNKVKGRQLVISR